MPACRAAPLQQTRQQPLCPKGLCTVNLAEVNCSATTIAVRLCKVGSVQSISDSPSAIAMNIISWSCSLHLQNASFSCSRSTDIAVNRLNGHISQLELAQNVLKVIQDSSYQCRTWQQDFDTAAVRSSEQLMVCLAHVAVSIGGRTAFLTVYHVLHARQLKLILFLKCEKLQCGLHLQHCYETTSRGATQ